MQAIGYLSRREHSRQELRTKLLSSLRQREREAAAPAVAAEAAARELAQAIGEQPSNGIDDAFAPPPTSNPAAPAGRGAVRGSRRASAPAREPAVARDRGHVATPPRADLGAGAAASVADQLRLASGAPLPARLRAELARQGGAANSGATGTAGVDEDATASTAGAASDPDLERQNPEAAVDQLLDWLVAHQYLSETRFVESRVNARARKQGTMMIKHELGRHGLALEPEQAAALRETEFARALALWQRKFGAVAPDARLRARQARFLASRGFAADVVRRIVGGQEEEF
ncbi:MAG: regulatory protein RecX [Betaproteobacteria bacterium]